MPDERNALLMPQALDAWLAGHDPEASVGARLSIRTCPLACYLSAQTGYIWRIWGDEAEPAEGPQAEQVQALPAWARWFTAFVDSHDEPTISARAARAYLQMAAREHGQMIGDT